MDPIDNMDMERSFADLVRKFKLSFTPTKSEPYGS